MTTTNLKKLALATVVAVGSLAMAACGSSSSPLGPTDIGSGPTLSAAPTAATNGSATTSGKKGRRILPSNCAFGHELNLQVVAIHKDAVEIASNYDLSDSGCKGLEWTVSPEMIYEAFTLKVDRLYVYPGQAATDPAVAGFTVVATTPDGQVAKLYFDPSAKR